MGEHFTLDVKKDKLEVTEAGRQLARYSSPPSGPHAPAMDKLIEAIEKALQANHRFVLDHHYMIDENKVVIVDESTGRPMPDRHWREGLHQAVEAKEKVPIHVAADHAASITYQSYFRQYEKLAGMTGTVVQNSKEIRRVYKLRVVQIPTNKPIMRDAAAGPGVPDRGGEVRRHRAGRQADARSRPAGAGRHAVGGEVGGGVEPADGAGHPAPGAERQAGQGGGDDRRPRPASRGW